MVEHRQLWKRWLWGLGVLVVFLALVWRLERLATIVLLSFLLAYVLNPLVTRLTRLRFISRTFATVIALLGLLAGMLAMMLFIIPGVVSEFRQLMSRMPIYISQFKDTVVPWLEHNLAINVPLNLRDALDQFGQDLSAVAPKLIGPATSVVAQAFGGTFSVVSIGVGALMFPLFLFFLLKDFPRIVGAVDGLVPPRNRENLHQIGREIDLSLSAFLHGQFTVMLILGSLYSIGYSIVGIPVAIGVGLITGLLCFIPYVGAAVGFLLALLLSLLVYKGPFGVLGVIFVFIVVQVFDATFITPKILGGKLGVRPLWIIIALMAGGELFGFLGVLLAVPTTAVVKVLVIHSLEKYRSSALFLSATHPGFDSTSDKSVNLQNAQNSGPKIVE